MNKVAYMPNGHKIFTNYQMFQFVGKGKDLNAILHQMIVNSKKAAAIGK